MTKKHDSQSFSISTSTQHDVAYELSSYPNLDIEKIGGLSPVFSESSTLYYSPSSSLRPQPEHIPTDVSFTTEDEDDVGLDSSTSCSFVQPKTSTSSLRSILDRPRIAPSLSSDTLHCPAAMSSHSPFSAMNSARGLEAANAIQVMVHTTETISSETTTT